MNKYRVCFIAPAGYVHAACFNEVVFLLKSTLDSLNVPCDLKINELAHDRLNIVVGYHLLQYGEYLAKYRYIVFQLEQLTAENGWYTENVRQLLEHAQEVWDYSRENISFLKTQGINASFVPLGYHAGLQQIKHASRKDVDVLFYGSIAPQCRRAAILNELMARRDIRVKILNSVYGRERDEWIGRSKIILNIHHYASQIFEAVRVSYLLNNKCFVVSETSHDYPYEKVPLPLIPYYDLIDSVRGFLANDDEIERLRGQLHEDFKANYKMEELIKSAIT